MKQSTIIREIISRLSGVNDLRYISADSAQTERDTPETVPVKFPCALVGITHANLEHWDKEGITYRYMIQVRLLDAPGVFATSSAPDAHAERALLIYDIVDRIEETLRSYVLENFGRVREELSSDIPRPDGLVEKIIQIEAIR